MQAPFLNSFDKAMSSDGCCGCFASLLRRPKRVPDMSDMCKRPRVDSYEEAFKLQRPLEGTFSPKFTSDQWASPAPREWKSDADMDLDLVVDIVEQTGGNASLPLQIDSDIPEKRLSKSAGQRAQPSTYEMEQLVASPGSLPRPLAPEQREAAIRSMLPTATYQMLSRVPPEFLNAGTAHAQALRRRLSRGATVAFVSAGLPGKKFTFERAAALGIKSVVIDHPDSWAKSMLAEGLIAKFLPVDMSQGSDAIFEQSFELIKELGEDGVTGRVDGIATFVELSVPLVSRLCERLGLPGHRPGSVDMARNKYETRAALKRAGLPTPKNALIRSLAELDEAMNTVGFPAVLKPVSGAASLGVKKVENAQECRGIYNEVVQELSTLVVSSGALIKGTADSAGVDAANLVDLTVLMEQYLDGCEVDVDVIMSQGEWCYTGVSDNGPTLEPYFNETWAVCPSLLPKEKQRELKELSVGSVKALGFTSGVFHVECKYTSSGPQLIEVNARMGGGQVHECNLRTWGVDLVEETLFAALGIPARPEIPNKPYAAVAYCYVNAVKSGRVKDMTGLEALRSRKNVVWAKPLVKDGAEVVGPANGLPTWLCDLLVTGGSSREALDFLLALEAEQPVKVL